MSLSMPQVGYRWGWGGGGSSATELSLAPGLELIISSLCGLTGSSGDVSTLVTSGCGLLCFFLSLPLPFMLLTCLCVFMCLCAGLGAQTLG